MKKGLFVNKIKVSVADRSFSLQDKIADVPMTWRWRGNRGSLGAEIEAAAAQKPRFTGTEIEGGGGAEIEAL